MVRFDSLVDDLNFDSDQLASYFMEAGLRHESMQNHLMIEAVSYNKVKSLAIQWARRRKYYAECDPLMSRIILRTQRG